MTYVVRPRKSLRESRLPSRVVPETGGALAATAGAASMPAAIAMSTAAWTTARIEHSLAERCPASEAGADIMSEQ